MFQTLDPKSLTKNVFSMIGDEWMLVTAGTEGHLNTMTASWGGLGVLWGKNVATIYIRKPRYTYEFLEANEYFTLSFLGGEHRERLAFCGSRSGRDVDKVKECGFTVRMAGRKAPYFGEAGLVLVCRKIYYDDLKPERFLEEEIETFYPKKDYHRIYIGEIAEVLSRG